MDFLSEKKQFVPPEGLGTKFAVAEVQRFIVDCLVAAGASRENAVPHAEVMVAADVRGHYSHGLQRLDLYVAELRHSVADGHVTPEVLKESIATALVDGKSGLGGVVGSFCMDKAIEKARSAGVGWVCARGSNHYGIAGWYAVQAANQGLIGMSFTNACSGVLATRAKKGLMGTNPIAVAAPGKAQDNFELDMATSVVASGKVELAVLKKETIPSGWLVDGSGQPTTDPTPVQTDGILMPLGGAELHSGYKGSGLGMMVEIFCGILSGGDYAHTIRNRTNFDTPANRSQCFVAINPAFFAPGFEDRMNDLMGYCRNMEPADPSKPVLVAGDPERAHSQKIKEDGGITYHPNQAKSSWQIAKFISHIEKFKSYVCMYAILN
ncbi:uncharacterized oxidoreductase YjmC-like isoform X1 [Eriocheir sinensis]|uniref:uncharacterized oxidoreductase YjmC-like isoform X1 n=2 Tax=Eriocheir sinensis TaxID=95602 RepID=UPI0021C7DD61|nr:uncharacterized oxidoreductase YjmC-like isoform X1 [Eriocheir sinensis]